MEELVKKIEGVLSQFFMECRGNRLNQFDFTTLKNIIITEIKNYKPGNIKDEVKKDNGISK